MRQLAVITLTVLQVLAALFLWRRGLFRSHLALVLYLVFGACVNCVLQALDPSSPAYLRVWALTLPVGSLLCIATGWQAYGRSLETSPRARKLSHRLLLATCVGAALVAQLAQETFTVYGVFSRIDQGVSAALGLFCLIFTPVLNTFYSPRRRANAVRQEWILSVFYVGNALALLATHWKLFPWNGYLTMMTAGFCSLSWIWLLRPEGELLPPPDVAQPDDRLVKLDAEVQVKAIGEQVKSATRSK